MEDAGEEATDLNAYMVMCWHHLRNIWIKEIVARLTRYLNEALAVHLARIDPEDCIGSVIENLLRVCEKYFCLKKWYAKGDGDRFQDWMEENYPGVILMSLERACLGAQQDICVEGARAV